MKRPTITVYFTAAIMLLLVFVLSCKKNELKEVPLLKTLAAVNINSTSVSCGGEITSEGSGSVGSRGVCWSLKPNPTTKYKDSLTVDGSGMGIFKSNISGLKQGNTYYIKAYASNSAGTGYGNQVSALLAPALPTLTTSIVIATNETSVNSGGNVLSNGGSTVFNRGVCWSTTKSPTIDNSFSTDGAGDGIFTSSISNLTPDATYYLRAFATNSVGTAYGEERSFTTGKLLIKDMDGNFYHFVTIGTQVWMAENLRTTRYRDSTSIQLIVNSATWSSQVLPGYCWYNSEETNKDSYGALYNWYTVNTGKLCPTGWHVPTDAEWTTLTTRLGGEPVAGGKLKEIGIYHWKTPNANATNESGFGALPGGYRTNAGDYVNGGSYGNWWSTTSTIANVANYRYMYYGNGTVTKSFINQKYGLSVRCLKN